jgi:hypothetical protein
MLETGKAEEYGNWGWDSEQKAARGERLNGKERVAGIVMHI